MGWIGTKTDAGKALIAQLPGGEHTLTLTKASIGTGTVAEIDLHTQTAVSGEKMDVEIHKVKYSANGVSLCVRVGPASALVGAFTGKQIGIWGKLDSGTETLITLSQNSTGIDVPTESSSLEFAYDLWVTIATEDSGSITVSITTSVYVSAQDLEEYNAGISVSFGTVSSLPVTKTDDAITGNMIVTGFDIADEEAFASEPTVTISNGSAVLSGTLENGKSTTVVIYLAPGDSIS